MNSEGEKYHTVDTVRQAVDAKGRPTFTYKTSHDLITGEKTRVRSHATYKDYMDGTYGIVSGVVQKEEFPGSISDGHEDLFFSGLIL